MIIHFHISEQGQILFDWGEIKKTTDLIKSNAPVILALSPAMHIEKPTPDDLDWDASSLSILLEHTSDDNQIFTNFRQQLSDLLAAVRLSEIRQSILPAAEVSTKWSDFLTNKVLPMVETAVRGYPKLSAQQQVAAINFFFNPKQGKGPNNLLPFRDERLCDYNLWPNALISVEDEWIILIREILNLSVKDIYNADLSKLFIVEPFEDIINQRINFSKLSDEQIKKFIGVIKYFIALRLQIAILTEKPPFPEKVISSEPKIAFELFLKHASQLNNEESPDRLIDEILPTYAMTSGRKQITGITYSIISEQIKRCGTVPDTSPHTAWSGEAPSHGSLAQAVRKMVFHCAKTNEDSRFCLQGISASHLRRELIGICGVSQFDARVALLILMYLKTIGHKSLNIFDPTAGWGDRLLAIIVYMKKSASAHKVWINDINSALLPCYNEIINKFGPEFRENIQLTDTPIEELEVPPFDENTTIFTSPPYIKQDPKSKGTIEKYQGANSEVGPFEWWRTTMQAIVYPGKHDPDQYIPRQDGAMIVLVLNRYMAEELKRTYYRYYKMILEVNYPSFMQRSTTTMKTAVEIIVIYKRSFTLPPLYQNVHVDTKLFNFPDRHDLPASIHSASPSVGSENLETLMVENTITGVAASDSVNAASRQTIAAQSTDTPMDTTPSVGSGIHNFFKRGPDNSTCEEPPKKLARADTDSPSRFI